jgi:ferric-dicitrate binding protein FerR (iron transport regulator)
MNEEAREHATVRLLRTAGPRAEVPALRAERVRTTVRAAWRADRRQRVIRARLVLAAAFTGAAALVFFAVRAAIDAGAPAGEAVAVVAAIEGTPPGIHRADIVRLGQWIETGDRSRVALRFGRDRSVRLDVQTRMRALSPQFIELASGAIYLDTGEEDAGFEVRTPLGTAYDIGTQFELRLIDQSLRLRVRTGSVEFRDEARAISARTGTEVMVSAHAAVTRPIVTYGSEWAWVSRMSPPFEMDSVPLAQFLARVAREQGWTVTYAPTALADEAETIILHGSVSHLGHSEAVDVAIATSGLRHRLEGGSLVVFSDDAMPSDQRDPRR